MTKTVNRLSSKSMVVVAEEGADDQHVRTSMLVLVLVLVLALLPFCPFAAHLLPVQQV